MATKRYELILAGNVQQLESALRQAEKSAAKLAGSTKGLRGGSRDVSVFGSALRTAGANAGRSAGVFRLTGSAISGMRSIARDAVGTMAGFVGAQAVVAGLGRAWRDTAQATIEFDRNMRNVNSLLGLSETQYARLGDQVLDLSRRLPQTASELSAGLYDIASSGFSGADGMMVLEAAASAASAGLSSTATSAAAIAAVLKAYGLSAAHAAEVSDTLFQTVNVGVISFDELAQGIGDWVGTAATLGVSVDDASAALATMTLSGVQAAEAGTSLNRVFLSLIKPSDQMATLIHSWGYESGIAAVKALGFRGVMERVRTETGGTADAMAGLFPEVRGLRGGLALLANDGRNYLRVAQAYPEAHRGAGQTAKVLREQARSLEYQLRVLGNRFRAAGIDAGRWASPSVALTIGAIGTAAHRAADWVGRLGDRAGPGLRALGDAARDAGRLVAELAGTFGPLLGALAAVAAAGAVDVFNALARAVSGTTGFLSDHEVIVVALASAYVASLIPAVAQTGAALARLAGTQATAWLAQMGGSAVVAARQLTTLTSAAYAVGGLTGSVSVLGAALMAALTSVTAIAAAAGVAIYGTWQGTKKLESGAKSWVQSFAKDFDSSSLDGLNAAVATSGKKFREARENARAYDGVVGNLKNIGQRFNPWQDDRAARWAERAKAAQAELRDVEKQRLHYRRQLEKVAGKGATDADLRGVERLAKVLGQDLTQSGTKGAAAVKLTRESMQRLGREAGYSSEQLKHAGTVNADVLQEQIEAAQKMQDAVSAAFSKSMDLLNVKPLEGQQKVTAGAIRQFYRDQLGAADQFLTDLERAYTVGFDPQLLARMLQAGPEQAGQALHALVSDTSAGMVSLVNNAEESIRSISARAVEAARLQQQALTKTDDIARQLPTALRISAEKTRQGAAATASSIAAALKLDPKTVAEIASSYDIVLPDLKATVSVNKEVALTDLDAVRAAMEQIPRSITSTPSIHDPEKVKAWWDNLKVHLEEIPGLRETVAKIDDPQQALVWWRKLQLLVSGTDGQRASVYASIVDDGVVATLTRARDLLAAIRANPSVTLTVRQQVIASGGDPRAAYTGRHSSSKDFGQADGGIVSFRRLAGGGVLRVRDFAAGGERHVAQIARPGDWRVWAEPETGGEAYIPLAGAKRARSVAILDDVAGRFGYDLVATGATRHAAGGVAAPPRPARTVTRINHRVSISTTINLPPAPGGTTAVLDRRQMKDLRRELDERDRRLARTLRGLR